MRPITSRWAERAGFILLAVGLLAMWRHAVQARHDAGVVAAAAVQRAETAVHTWQAAYRTARDSFAHDTVTVTHRLVSYDTVRDTLRFDATRITDTVYVRQLVQAADSAVRSCRVALGRVGPLLTACDSAQAALRRDADAWRARYDAVRPRWWDRLSIGPTYGLVLVGHQVHLAPGVMLELRVWP